MLIAGIDPGKTGGVAIMDMNRNVVQLCLTPTVRVGKTKRDYDVAAMARILSEHEISMALVERQQAFPGQGRSSLFNLGVGYGIWLGILGALQIPHDTVSPTVWTKSVLRGVQGEGKLRNIKGAMRLFPGTSLLATERSKRPHDGLADALLIGEYCSRMMRQ